MWMRESYIRVEIKFIPTSVDEKAMFGDKLTFLPTIVKEKSYVCSQNEIFTPDKVVPFIRYLSLGVMKP